ncbi:NlpC/P60 family protein [Algicella marina]|uniref:Peptidase n=1 Tax=Algicella marina TaxID=2683284 RepID=A0A6P1SYK2_9RHOB|nr:NlpC/P60 family protein [Algicella marina]QHQ34561.1 peptidase [Algicella marina]
MTFDQQIVAAARTWIGTPYVHQASCRGAGADCLGLLRGVWREVLGAEPEAVPAYTADWSETDGVERLLPAAGRHLHAVAWDDRAPGDVLIFRMRRTGVAKHVGLLSSLRPVPEFIHAYSGRGVVASPLSTAWAHRVAGVFRFPDRSD